MRFIWTLVVAGACGGIEGEPIEGTIGMSYGGSDVRFAVGAVVEDQNTAGQMLVQVGTDNVDCETYLDVLFSFSNPEGTFLYFSVEPAPGTYTEGLISAMRSSGNSTKINAANGSVTIDSVGDRVLGTVDFAATDDEVGEITASGTFDVVKCF